MSSSEGVPESWISSFCSLMGHEYFAEVSEDFIEDDFNLTGLQSQVPMYKEALEMILDVEPEEDEEEEEEEEEDDDEDEILGEERPLGYRRAGDRRHMRVSSDLSMIESSAELLYGLIHQRYITSRPGIQQMLEKYEVHHFGVCPRVNCNGCKVLPVGRTDTPGQETVKLFCPSCYDIYTPPNSRFQSVDGAFFGTTFGCLFFMTFPELDVGGNRAESILSPALHGAGSNNPNQSRSSSLNTSVALTAGTIDQTLPPPPPTNQPTQINGILTSNFAPGLGFIRIYEPRIYGFRVSERAKSGPRMQWLRMKPRDVNEIDESTIYFTTHGVDDEGVFDDGDTEMGSKASAAGATSQQSAIGMRRKAPMRKRRHIPPSNADQTTMTNNGEGG